jgi:phenylacetic acid degradation operon negative regulatory protein
MPADRAFRRSAPLPDPHVRRWIARQIAGAPPRAPSLIVTLWGDALVPHGGAVLLPGLIRLLAPFGLSERLVRTSVFRLVRQGWIAATPVGRRSLYALTPDGKRRFAAAHRRIYGAADDRWDDTWEIVVGDGLDATLRRALANELGWAGFGEFGSAVWARPAHSDGSAARVVAALGLAQRVIVVRGRDDSTLGAKTLAAAVPQAWDLTEVAARYRDVLRRFGTVIERFRASDDATHDPQQAFVVRTLLIHAYRRALLRDPQLPAALLPLDWPGAAAHVLCRDFYRLTHRAAERHLALTLADASGALPPAAPEYARRFGGLARSSTAR